MGINTKDIGRTGNIMEKASVSIKSDWNMMAVGTREIGKAGVLLGAIVWSLRGTSQRGSEMGEEN